MIKKMLLVLTLLALGGLSSTVFSTRVNADDEDGAITSNLQVTVISSQDTAPDHLQVEATMSATLKRTDGSQGTYKVPVTIIYPKDSTKCNGVGLLDVINSVFYETFEFTGTANDPFFPSVFPFAHLILGDDFLKNRGYVYASAQWNKLVIERQREAGTLSDSSLHIDEGTDGFFILRDLSTFLRRPSDFLVGPVPTPPCAVDDVIAFGISQTGMLLRQFYFAKLNTKLATNQAFDEGLVFEGSIHGLPGSRCRSLSNDSPWFSYSFEDCEKETPREEGKVITINTETGVQIVGGWMARPDDDDDVSHYRVYELAGTSHIPAPLLPLKLVGLRPTDGQDQNYADIAPVFRAMIQHLQNWVKGNGEPPQSALVQRQTGHLDTPLFSRNAWGSDGSQVSVMKLGEDGNVLMGVRLPHVRTVLPGGQQIGGPLGVYRGTECDNDPTQSDFILDCQLSGDLEIYNMAGGTFKPYVEFNSELCNTFYDSHESYVSAVRNAAEYAAAEGWVLPEEVDSLVLAAELKADEFPGCVPNNTN
jgi:hypothetical protein